MALNQTGISLFCGRVKNGVSIVGLRVTSALLTDLNVEEYRFKKHQTTYDCQREKRNAEAAIGGVSPQWRE